MSTVTVSDADVEVLGASVRSGFLQVRPGTVQGGALAFGRPVEVPLHQASFDCPDAAALKLTTRGVRGVTRSWLVPTPTTPVSLSVLLSTDTTPERIVSGASSRRWRYLTEEN